MSYGSPCRCTCGARSDVRFQYRAPPRQQRYARVKLSRQARLAEQSSIVTTFGFAGTRSLTEGVAGEDADAFIELLSSRQHRDSVADDGYDSRAELTQATSIGCATPASNVISRRSSSGNASASASRSRSNEMTSSERLVVQLFMDEVDVKEKEMAAALEAAAREHEEDSSSGVMATTNENESPWPSCSSAETERARRRGTRMGCGALVAPSTLTFVVLAAVLVWNVLLAIVYYEERTWLCASTLGLMHAPSLVLFVSRIYSVVVRESVKEHFMKALVLLWYVVTLPLLHCLPLLTLSSVLFDKVMMVMGDPSDTRPFIGHQEEVAFGDLVWVAVLHAFPQAVLQLHMLLFTEDASFLRGEWPDYTAVLQTGSALSGALLIACVATFYSKYVVRGRWCDEETTDGSTTYETTTTAALQDCDEEDTRAGYLLKFSAWLLIASSRIIAGASLLAVYFGPAVLALALAHVPVVLLWSLVCRSRYSWAKFFGDIALGLMTLVFVLDYRALNREGLASTMSAVVFLCATFVENTVCLVLAYLVVGGEPPHYTVLLVVVGAHYAAMACGVFLLLCHFRIRHRKAEYVF